MAMWTLVLFLAALGTVPVSADTVRFIEGPVLLRFNRSHTVVRCSIEVTGGLSPRIEFYINGTLSSKFPPLSCNPENVQPYQLEDESVPRQCPVNNTDGEMKKRVHQAMTVTTCPDTQSSFDPIAIQCVVRSDIEPTVNGTESNTMHLNYNDKDEPCLDAQEGEAVIFMPDPVCPNEDLGKICLQTPPPTSPPPPSLSSAQPTVAPSASPTPFRPTTGGDASGQLSEGKLMLIIYVASGAAAFFALLVVCLVGMLCCMVVKKHHMQKAAAPLAQGRRGEVAIGLGLGPTEDEKTNNRAKRSSTPESIAHQLALHRSSGSSQSGSIRSNDENGGHVRTSVEVRDVHPGVGQGVLPSAPNPLSLRPEAAAEAALQEHDYDSIDEDWPVPNKKENDAAVRKINTYVPGYETPPLHVAVSDAGSDRNDPFPTLAFASSSMERTMYSTPRKQQDYVNRPVQRDYVNNGHPSHDYANDGHPVGAVYHNSFMFRAEIHDYKNQHHLPPDSKVQTLMDMSQMTDSYQELNTVDSSSSLTVDPSHLETFPSGLQQVQTSKNTTRDTGAATHGSENVYHTVYPSDGDSGSSSSSDYSVPRNAAARVATVGAPAAYDKLSPVNSDRSTHVPMRNTSAPSTKRVSEYTDLEIVNMEGTSDYSTLKSTETVCIGTQTYGTSTA